MKTQITWERVVDNECETWFPLWNGKDRGGMVYKVSHPLCEISKQGWHWAYQYFNDGPFLTKNKAQEKLIKKMNLFTR